MPSRSEFHSSSGPDLAIRCLQAREGGVVRVPRAAKGCCKPPTPACVLSGLAEVRAAYINSCCLEAAAHLVTNPQDFASVVSVLQKEFLLEGIIEVQLQSSLKVHQSHLSKLQCQFLNPRQTFMAPRQIFMAYLQPLQGSAAALQGSAAALQE
ncbi:hypothetical protein CRENBAI_024145 [Crenichthys baileyi]|uniref:Uncharacterized protein n=1 Tax=Crenichthys baileyi TaxID=28760 RepID=A0AAV9SPW6_9TELE